MSKIEIVEGEYGIKAQVDDRVLAIGDTRKEAYKKAKSILSKERRMKQQVFARKVLSKKKTVMVMLAVLMFISSALILLLPSEEIRGKVVEAEYYSLPDNNTDIAGIKVLGDKPRDTLTVRVEDTDYKAVTLSIKDDQVSTGCWLLIPEKELRENYLGDGSLIFRQQPEGGEDCRLVEGVDWEKITLYDVSAFVFYTPHFSSVTTTIFCVNGTVILTGSVENGTIENFYVGENVANASIIFTGHTIYEGDTWITTTDSDFGGGDCNDTEVYTNKIILKRKEYNETDDEWQDWVRWNKVPHYSERKIKGFKSNGVYKSEPKKVKDPIVSMTLYVNKLVPPDTSLGINMSLCGGNNTIDITNAKIGEQFNFTYDPNNTDLGYACDFNTNNPFTTAEFGGTPVFGGIIARYTTEDRTNNPRISINGHEVIGFDGELADGESSGIIDLNITHFMEDGMNSFGFYAESSLDYKIVVNYTDEILVMVDRANNTERQTAVYVPSQNGTNINLSLFFDVSAMVNKLESVSMNNTTAGADWDYVWDKNTGNLTFTFYTVTAGETYYIGAEMLFNNPPKVGHIIGKKPVMKGEALGLWDDSEDDDGNDLNHTWDFGDGTYSNISCPVHIWNEGGHFLIHHTVIEINVFVNITIYHITETINVTVVNPECKVLDDAGDETSVFDYNHFSLNETHIMSDSWIMIKNGSRLNMKVGGLINGTDAIPSDWNIVFYLYEEFGNISNYVDYYIVNDTLEFQITSLNTSRIYYLKGSIVDAPDHIRTGEYLGLTGMGISFDGYANFNFLTKGTVLNTPPVITGLTYDNSTMSFKGGVYDLNGEGDIGNGVLMVYKNLSVGSEKYAEYNVTFVDYGWGDGNLSFTKQLLLGHNPYGYWAELNVSDTGGVMVKKCLRIPFSNILPLMGFNMPNTVTVFDMVTYVSTSFDPDGSILDWVWEFGDGVGGTGSAVSHKYITAGTYTVNLTCVDNIGDTNRTSKNIVVNGANPTAFFVGDIKAKTLEECYYDANDSSDIDGVVVSYLWDFGDNTTKGVGVFVSHAYMDNGAYVVNLTVTDNDGRKGYYNRMINVLNRAPVVRNENVSFFARAEYELIADCEDLDGEIVNYTWTINNRTLYGDRNTIIYNTICVLNGSLTVVDDDNATTHKMFLVRVVNNPPVVVVAYSHIVLSNSTVVFDASGCYDIDGNITSVEWYIDGVKITGNKIGHTFTDVGIYHVLCSVTDDNNDTTNTTYTITVAREEGFTFGEMSEFFGIGIMRLDMMDTCGFTCFATKNGEPLMNGSWNVQRTDKGIFGKKWFRDRYEMTYTAEENETLENSSFRVKLSYLDWNLGDKEFNYGDDVYVLLDGKNVLLKESGYIVTEEDGYLIVNITGKNITKLTFVLNPLLWEKIGTWFGMLKIRLGLSVLNILLLMDRGGKWCRKEV